MQGRISLLKEPEVCLCHKEQLWQHLSCQEFDSNLGLDKECNTTLCEADLCPDKKSVTPTWAWMRTAMRPCVKPTYAQTRRVWCQLWPGPARCYVVWSRLMPREECDTNFGLDQQYATLCEADLCPDKKSVMPTLAWTSNMLPCVKLTCAHVDKRRGTNLGLDEERNSTLCEAYLCLHRQEEHDICFWIMDSKWIFGWYSYPKDNKYTEIKKSWLQDGSSERNN